jgi:hypothetical protein
MAIKITVTGNKYPGGGSPTTFRKSKTTFVKGVAIPVAIPSVTKLRHQDVFAPTSNLINKGLLLRIQDSVKDPKSPLSAKVREALDKVAKARIKETRSMALSHYQRTINKAISLTQNSQIRAEHGGREQVEGYNRSGETMKYAPVKFDERDSISSHLIEPSIGVNAQVHFVTLNVDYYHRTPKSQWFFTKRGNTGAIESDKMVKTAAGTSHPRKPKGASSRLKMVSELSKVKTSTLTASHNVGLDPVKGIPASTSGKASTTLKYSYVLKFASLAKYDFIRKSYLHAAEQGITRLPRARDPLDNKLRFDKTYGILYAERLRPFFRVLAAEAGKDLRKQLTLKT